MAFSGYKSQRKKATGRGGVRRTKRKKNKPENRGER